MLWFFGNTTGFQIIRLNYIFLFWLCFFFHRCADRTGFTISDFRPGIIIHQQCMVLFRPFSWSCTRNRFSWWSPMFPHCYLRSGHSQHTKMFLVFFFLLGFIWHSIRNVKEKQTLTTDTSCRALGHTPQKKKNNANASVGFVLFLKKKKKIFFFFNFFFFWLLVLFEQTKQKKKEIIKIFHLDTHPQSKFVRKQIPEKKKNIVRQKNEETTQNQIGFSFGKKKATNPKQKKRTFKRDVNFFFFFLIFFFLRYPP